MEETRDAPIDEVETGVPEAISSPSPSPSPSFSSPLSTALSLSPPQPTPTAEPRQEDQIEERDTPNSEIVTTDSAAILYLSSASSLSTAQYLSSPEPTLTTEPLQQDNTEYLDTPEIEASDSSIKQASSSLSLAPVSSPPRSTPATEPSQEDSLEESNAPRNRLGDIAASILMVISATEPTSRRQWANIAPAPPLLPPLVTGTGITPSQPAALMAYSLNILLGYQHTPAAQALADTYVAMAPPTPNLRYIANSNNARNDFWEDSRCYPEDYYPSRAPIPSPTPTPPTYTESERAEEEGRRIDQESAMLSAVIRTRKEDEARAKRQRSCYAWDEVAEPEYMFRCGPFAGLKIGQVPE